MRYRVDQVPPRGAAAFMPGLTTNPVASSWGLVRVQAYPGTLAVPSPPPAGGKNAAPGGAPADRTRGSANSPDVFFPAIYANSARNMGPTRGALGVKIVSDNPLPVPAIDPGRAPGIAMRPAILTGVRQVPWPRTLVNWPSITKQGT